jgi:hypothetical protein
MADIKQEYNIETTQKIVESLNKLRSLEFTNEDVEKLTQDTVDIKPSYKDIFKSFLDAMYYDYVIKDGVFTVTIQDINEFMKHLVENEVSIISITQNKTSLEDIFLSSIKEATV